MSKATKADRNKRKRPLFFKRKGFWVLTLLILVMAALIGVLVVDRMLEPYRERASGYDLSLVDKVEVPSVIVGRNGGELGRVFVQNRSVIRIDKVPDRFISALRAGEDKRYFDHKGVDYMGILRAGIDWLRVGEAVSGASTITQQLARGAYDLEAERKKRGESGIERKLVEAFLAQRIETVYSKREILEFYLNRIYFGSGFYGIRSASLGYFGKEPENLTDGECATIVGLIKNPTGLSPLNNIEACRVSRNMVIERMMNLDMITPSEAARMRADKIKLNPKPLQRGTSHLYERIASEIRTLLGDEALAEGGYTIQTSIDTAVQQSAERKLEAMLVKAENHPGFTHPRRGTGDPKQWLQGGVLMVDQRNGGVIAHVGGRDYATVPFDVIELGRRPLGTAFFPMVYSAALESGLTPASGVEDEEMDNRTVMVGGREGILGEWGMEVPNPSYEHASITLRRALESSKVAATVRLANQVGLEKVRQTAIDFGLPFDNAELLPRLAVGWEPASLKEAVKAYTAFARDGRTGPERMWYVESVRDSHGSIRYERPIQDQDGTPAVSSATAFQVHSILQGGMSNGSAKGVLDSLVESPFNGACKTGTTHDFSDAWTLGYNGRVTCGVWVGFLNSGDPIYEGAFGRDLAMPVWVEAMNQASKHFGGRSIPQPESVVEMEICRVSGERVTPYCYETFQDPVTGSMRSRPAGVAEYFRRGTEKIPYCSKHSGSAPEDPTLDITVLPVIDTSPVRPKEPVLLGDDPYHSIQITEDEGPKFRVRRERTNVLDSLDLNDGLDQLRLPRPRRLEIAPE
ncbi:transglycosylase domain-containing protein [Haloferula sargassicola]|uniref:Penicillin-binding protein 2D n=1 Tax=Haloferula sargassicola TaxID=490096 RepID=A0ABP9UWA3_9BACT